HRGDGNVDERVARDLPEDGVARERDEIREADEGARARNRTVLEAQEYPVEERIRDEREQEEHAGRQHEPAEEPFALDEAGQGKWPARERRRMRDRRRPYSHRLFRFVDLLQLCGGRRDHVLGGLTLAGLGEHVDDDVFRHALGGGMALWPRPPVQARRLEGFL